MASGFFADSEVGWTELHDYQKGSFVKYNQSGRCHRIGARLLPNYNTDMQAQIQYINVDWDADRDGLADAEEALLGTSVGDVDTDADGCADGRDPKPGDGLSSTPLPLDVTCSGGICAYTTHFGNNSAIIQFTPLVHQNCTITWSHMSVNSSAPVLLKSLNRAPQEIATFIDSAVDVALSAGQTYTFLARNADFAPVVDSAMTSLVHAMSNGDLELPLAPLAYDVEDDTIDLTWLVTSSHNHSELACVIATPNATVGQVLQCSYDDGQCRTHNMTLEVADSAGNLATLDFRVHLFGGEGQELVTNGGMENLTAVGGLAGWSRYTWAGLYETGASARPTSARHAQSAQVEGLTAGRGAIYQEVSRHSHTAVAHCRS